MHASTSTTILAALAAALLGLAVPGQAATVTATNTNGGVADGSSFTRDVTFTAGDLGGQTIITDLDVTIDFAKISAGCIPFLDEIEFVLTGPAGTNFTLISNSINTAIVAADNFDTFDSGFANFDGAVTFDQSAAPPVDFDPNLIPSGTFRPDDDTQGSLNLFNGESALGTFTLFIQDDFTGGPLRFDAFTVTLTTAAVPEPTAALGATAMLGLAALRRRRGA